MATNSVTYDRRINLYINGSEITNDIRTISKEYQKARNEIAGMTRGSEEYNAKLKELRSLKGIIKEHNDAINSSGGAFAKIKETAASGMGLLAAGVAGIAAAYNSAKFIIASTDELADKVEITLGGWKNGIVAVGRAIATMNFKDFTKNIKSAIEEGRRYAESLDNIDEKTRALKIAESEANNEILKQTEISRSAKSTKDEQIAAGKKIIQLEEDLTKIRMGIGEQAYLNESKNIQDATHLTEKEILAFAKRDEAMVANIETGKLYNEANKKLGLYYGGAITLTEQEYKKLTESIKNASDEVKRFALAATNMPGDDKMQLFADKYVAYQQAIGSGLEGTMKTRIRVAKNEEALDNEEEKRQKDDLDLKARAAKYTDEYFENEKKRNQELLDDRVRAEKYTDEYFENEKKRNQELQDLKATAEQYTNEYFEKEKNRNLTDLENEFIIKSNNILAQLDIEKKKNEILKQNEIDEAERTGASVQLINQKYAVLDKKLDEEKLKTKLQLAADFFGNMSTILGKQTAAGKAAAIAETTINTYASATAAYKSLAGIPIVGPVLGIAAAAAAITAGLLNVRQILKVNTETKGYSIGGYTPSGNNQDPAGIVHKNEWVAPARMVASPVTGPIIRALEKTRVKGYSQGGLVDEVQDYSSGSGKGQGSGASLPSPIPTNVFPLLQRTLEDVRTLLAQLKRDGVTTRFDYIAADNVRKGIETLDNIKKKSSM